MSPQAASVSLLEIQFLDETLEQCEEELDFALSPNTRDMIDEARELLRELLTRLEDYEVSNGVDD